MDSMNTQGMQQCVLSSIMLLKTGDYCGSSGPGQIQHVNTLFLPNLEAYVTLRLFALR